MEIKAVAKNIHITPRKLRLIADFVRGQDIIVARQKLAYLSKSGASPVSKVLESAISNAVNNFKLALNDIFLKNIFVDEGRIFMRKYDRSHSFRYSRGMIKRQGAHITVILETKKEAAK